MAFSQRCCCQNPGIIKTLVPPHGNLRPSHYRRDSRPVHPRRCCCISQRSTAAVRPLAAGVGQWVHLKHHLKPDEVEAVILEIGPSLDTVVFVPISGWSGDRTLEPGAHVPALLGAPDCMLPPAGQQTQGKPLRDDCRTACAAAVPVGRRQTCILFIGTAVSWGQHGLQCQGHVSQRCSLWQ